jgi:Ca-activated chloride channel family protein
MRVRRFFCLLVAFVAPLAAQGPPSAFFISPVAGEALFGKTALEVEVEVEAAVEVRQVAFWADDRVVGRVTAPPYRVEVDFGQENRTRHLAAVIYFRDGQNLRIEQVAPALRVDDEVNLNLQQLYVTAQDRGQRVLDLEPGEIQLFDEGQRQTLVTLERGHIPMSAILLLDGSGSMRGQRLEVALQGARAFVSDLHSEDRVQLLVAADRLLGVSPEVSRGEPIEKILQTTDVTGGTTLYDHLFLALELLEQRQGRRVILLLSDGFDTTSVLSMEAVRHVVRRSQTMLYWVRLAHPALPTETLIPYSTWRSVREGRQGFKLLKRTVDETGGRTLAIDNLSAIGPTFAEILAELREQYALGYYPDPDHGDGRWREVRVETVRRGVKLRSRGGYYDRGSQ